MKKNTHFQNTIIIICTAISGFGYAQNKVEKDSVSNKLNEVIITKERKMFINKNGNIKVDVANTILNAVPNILDLLSKLPNVIVNTNKETISIVGKGTPLLYIDNQKVEMNDLNTLTVDDIKTIEIIKNPSSKYEAEGRAVILITRKFSKKEGAQIILSETASFKKEFNNYLGVNSSFKKNKMEWKANFNYNKLNPWESHSIDYQIPVADIFSKYNVSAQTKRNQYIFGSSLFYKINEDDYFSININSKLQTDTFGIYTNTYNKKENDVNNVVTKSDNDSDKNFVNSFINYSKKIKPINVQLFAGLQYSKYYHYLESLVENNFNDTQFEWSQNRGQKFDVDVISGRIDLDKKFKNEMKLEFGGLFLSSNAKTNIDILDLKTTTMMNSIYDFEEKNSAAYTQLSGNIKKVNYSFGVRIENTDIVGKFKNENTPLINKNYTNLFPKVQFEIPIDSTKSITFNYSKNILRPNYSSTSQNTAYINPYFLYGGNINLDPTIINEISTNFQHHDNSVKLSYYQNTDPVYSSFVFDNVNNILTFKETNFKKESGFNLEFTLPFTYKFWTSTNSFSFILNKIEADLAVMNSSKPYLYYYSNNNFKLQKGYTFSLNTRGMTKQNEGIFERKAMFIIEIMASKTFFTNWTCTLSYIDIFKNTIFQESFTVNNISSKARYLSDAHEFSIAIKYSFGKIKLSEFKEKIIDDNSNRIR